MRRAAFIAAILSLGTTAVQADDFPPGNAHDIVAKACTQCHVAAQVTSQHKTADQWADTVNQMISNGAQINDADFDKVVDYLAKNFGAAAGTSSSTPPAPH